MQTNKTTRLIGSVILGIAVIGGLIFIKERANLGNFFNNQLPENIASDTRLKKFGSTENFQQYIAEGQQKGQLSQFFAFDTFSAQGMAPMSLEAAPQRDLEAKTQLGGSSNTISSQRYSPTNVQVQGIDEPDVVKTNGQKIYYSNGLWNFIPFAEPAVREAQDMTSSSVPAVSIAPEDKIFPAPDQQQGKTSVLTASPLAEDSEISVGGELLLSGNSLVSIQSNKLTGFDVSDSKNPKEVWSSTLDNSSVATSRLKDGKLLIVTQTFINAGSPCPMPLMNGKARIMIACADIYHPVVNVGVDSTYTVMEVNPATGDVTKQVSLVGASGQSVIYVSENNLYITYSYPGDYVNFFYGFLADEWGDLVPSSVLDKLSALRGYDISTQSKLQEIQIILEQHKATLSEDDRLKFDQELQNRMGEYAKNRGRELQNTGIAKISLNNLQIAATGGVPGHPLNQFSLDEYQDHLRIATTSSSSFLVSTESTNDLYILNNDLKLSGSILDMGIGERIYATRFIGNKGYLVTFKQIDPFYVLDLSNPNDPKKAGELKIPGYSSYLHPISENMIMGVGQEEGNVKVSLFNVTDPNNPTEVSKYTLQEFWTEVQNNHHAFLNDSDNQTVFIPGGNGGYVISYANNELELERAINKPGVKRAIYIGNNLYVFSERDVTVYDQSNWQVISTLSL